VPPAKIPAVTVVTGRIAWRVACRVTWRVATVATVVCRSTASPPGTRLIGRRKQGGDDYQYKQNTLPTGSIHGLLRSLSKEVRCFFATRSNQRSCSLPIIAQNSSRIERPAEKRRFFRKGCLEIINRIRKIQINSKPVLTHDGCGYQSILTFVMFIYKVTYISSRISLIR
jgi:hypothetical protein